MPTGESDSTFWASLLTSWRLDFSSRLVIDLADQVGRLGALRSPAQGPLGTLKLFQTQLLDTSPVPGFLLPDASPVPAARRLSPSPGGQVGRLAGNLIFPVDYSLTWLTKSVDLVPCAAQPSPRPIRNPKTLPSTAARHLSSS
jgi:hypothetical protein